MVEVDEAITIVAYDPEWPRIAASEMARLHRGLGQQVVACEHFGSTAVPGCEAKPIVDLLVGTAVWPAPVLVREQLSSMGYEDLGEAGVPGRLYFRVRSSRAFNLAVTLHAGELWRTNLQVRELLRSDPSLARDYVAVKRAALSEGRTRLLDYSAHKAAFLAQLVARARGR